MSDKIQKIEKNGFDHPYVGRRGIITNNDCKVPFTDEGEIVCVFLGMYGSPMVTIRRDDDTHKSYGIELLTLVAIDRE